MTENPWVRLRRIADNRRTKLGYTWDGVRAAGGPSQAWMYKLAHEEGQPSVRQLPALAALDKALQWPSGTSRELLMHDLSVRSPADLAAEERDLVEHVDGIAHFAGTVDARLREIERVAGRVAAAAVKGQIREVLGLSYSP